jgi:hypothetical protein
VPNNVFDVDNRSRAFVRLFLRLSTGLHLLRAEIVQTFSTVLPVFAVDRGTTFGEIMKQLPAHKISNSEEKNEIFRHRHSKTFLFDSTGKTQVTCSQDFIFVVVKHRMLKISKRVGYPKPQK